MKPINYLLFLGAFFITSILFAQKKSTCAVLNINEVQVRNYSSEILGNITRREFSKLDIFEILYAQDIKPFIKKDSNNRNNSFDCYSKQCLVEIGRNINSDKMLSGQIEQIDDAIIISYRIIDVQTNLVEHSITKEFLNLNDQLKNMIIITLREMMRLENDDELENLLIKKFSRESYINNKGINRLNLSGTRMGVVTILGSNKEILKLPETEGGFDAVPTFFNFGYQFESQYLNQGRIQGLFEFIPSVTGLGQGLTMFSFTILHGIRDNKSGFEFAFGPTFSLSQEASGYYDDNKKWHLEEEWENSPHDPNDTTQTTPLNPYHIEKRLDSRGEYQLNAGFLIGIGFSIKSGEINIPINLYTVLQKDSFRTGISVGINSRKKKR